MEQVPRNNHPLEVWVMLSDWVAAANQPLIQHFHCWYYAEYAIPSCLYNICEILKVLVSNEFQLEGAVWVNQCAQLCVKKATRLGEVGCRLEIGVEREFTFHAFILPPLWLNVVLATTSNDNCQVMQNIVIDPVSYFAWKTEERGFNRIKIGRAHV